jgi:hypothetical protein
VRTLIELLILAKAILPLDAHNEDYALDSNFREDSVDIALEIRGPGSELRQWREMPPPEPLPDQGSQGEVGPPAPDSRGGSSGGATAPSAHYCVDEAGTADPACTSFLAAMPTFITNFTCSLGQQLADHRERRGLAPREVCAEDTPPLAATEEVVAEEAPGDTESEWELILTQIPGEVERAFTNLPIDGGAVSFDEELLGFGYINQHTNVFAEVEAQTFSESLLGIDVQIRAVPVGYQFDYGDGTSRSSSDPGGATIPHTPEVRDLPAVDVETPTSHIYRDTGVYPVNVTTTFIGEYRLSGADWTPISGSVDIPATPGEADIWRLSHRHVSGACREARHWGCSGPLELGPGDQPPKIFADEYDSNGRHIGPQHP